MRSLRLRLKSLFTQPIILIFFTQLLFLLYFVSTIKDTLNDYSDQNVTFDIAKTENGRSLDITIVVVVGDAQTAKIDYRNALESVKCYSQMHNYRFWLIEDKKFSHLCRQRDFMFRRHCIIANLLIRSEWILFLDADIAIVNPRILIEEFIDPRYDIIMYDRFVNWEIATGSYLVKNTEWSRTFLKRFANFENRLPNSFHGTDNGAFHIFLQETLFPKHNKGLAKVCMAIWEYSRNFDNLFTMEACVRSIIGEKRDFKKLKILNKGTGWVRDIWLTDSKWSPERDFMLHGLKEFNQESKNMQIRLHAKNTFTFILVVGFLYLGYLIFFASGDGLPEIDVDLKDVISYAVLAVEMGGIAVHKVHQEKSLNAAAKGLTDEGKEELLTRADLISNHLILDILQRFPRLSVVSEEKESTMSEREIEPYRSDNYAVWQSVKEILNKIPSRRLELDEVRVFVDPLDATQEFTEDLTQYVTVMACIVVKDEPIFGAIYRPFFNETIFGLKDWGVITSSGVKIEPVPIENTSKKVVVSRSHAGKVASVVKQVLGEQTEIEPAGGSGYKALRLVNGTAEIYLHTTAIKKWDTCAGDAILRTMGGAMLDLEGNPLKYSENEPIVNKKGLLATVRTPYTYFKRFSSVKLLMEVTVPFTPCEWAKLRHLLQSNIIEDVAESISLLNMGIVRCGESTPLAVLCSHVIMEAIYTDLQEVDEKDLWRKNLDSQRNHGFAIVR
ncbi:unnamed protein product [Caenorhabditis bovis]|uniref:Putative inositol monophosphatase 3 n=1 Tax=Caenorhabditis bovis TaxID=2654633 RepID=A0A8S1FCG0_9PELO|nr:unnamed protein product [Caenorhabditis bovis]